MKKKTIFNNILILDLNPIPSPEGNLGQFSKLIGNILPHKETSIQIISHFPPGPIDPSPSLIFLRSSPIESFIEVLLHVRKHWGQSFVVGLFCEKENTARGVFQCLESGLDDFISYPFKEIDLAPRILRLVKRENETSTFPRVEVLKKMSHREHLIGQSKPFLHVIEKIPSLAWSDATVIIYGETGTGKELIARSIHYNSQRHGKPFIPLNCGALPDHLIENELFGHAKGAFTDASTTEKGLIAEAEGGTLFLDEVDALSYSAQIKLLRFLQDKEYRHLGSSKIRVANVRIIAATNSNLRSLIETKCFREDLYYRLNVLSLTLPPLRERVSDIPLLVAEFLSRYAKQNRRGLLHLSKGAVQKLIHYHWPGNVRELEGVIQRAVVLCTSSVLEPEDIDILSPCGQELLEVCSLREEKKAFSPFITASELLVADHSLQKVKIQAIS
ncbi:MAG: sigma-54-dependent Fis family transcriptional regulator, partial [Candidatus Brocadia sp.]|nr:sigma-54-dependent Fis family transcriptional regulator [Candidatus Brocadia sp.]